MSMRVEAADGHAPCDWRGCAELARVPLQVSLRPPGSALFRDVVVRLCGSHAAGISQLCPKCGGGDGLGLARDTGVACTRCGGLGMIAIAGAVMQIDWSLIEAARAGLNQGEF